MITNTTTTEYPRWTATRSNEDFDRSQQLAIRLTDEDRATGSPAPQYGYSAERYDEAARIVRDANTYSAASQAVRAAEMAR